MEQDLNMLWILTFLGKTLTGNKMQVIKIDV